MMLLGFKLFLTPILIALVTIVGRRWGAGVSGWLTGLPLTSGPISLILALQYGDGFAVRSVVGSIGGLASVAIFCLAYAWIAPQASWYISVPVGMSAFLVATWLWNRFTLTLLSTFLLVLVLLALIYRLIPHPYLTLRAYKSPRWDLPARMLVATVFVIVLTGFAALLGPQVSGLLAPFPVFTSVLASFTHAQQGAHAGIRFLRGVVVGCFAAASFFLVVGMCLLHIHIAWTYTFATLIALLLNRVSLQFIQEKQYS